MVMLGVVVVFAHRNADWIDWWYLRRMMMMNEHRVCRQQCKIAALNYC